MSRTDRSTLAAAMADLIRSHDVFPERGDELAGQVDGWVAASIDAATVEAQAAALTDRLREASGDVHYKVMPRTFSAEELASAPQDRWMHSMLGLADNHGFRSIEVHDGIALLTLTSLDPMRWSEPTAQAALGFARVAERLIIDVRTCQGGDPELIGLLAGAVLGDDPVELSSVHWRDGSVEVLSSEPDRAAVRFDAAVPLVVVVGPNTASGGEALADHLQAPGRAIVVGQPTVGAAHRVAEFQLVDELVLRVPNGLVVNAFTGTDWEGDGVSPDVVVEPDDDPIDVARRVEPGIR